MSKESYTLITAGSQEMKSIFFRRNNKEEAKKMWREARDIFASLGAQMEVGRMKELPA